VRNRSVSCLELISCGICPFIMSATRLFLAGYLLLLVSIPTVADTPDFSGSYTLTGGNRRFDTRKASLVTLNVLQTLTEVEITMVKDGRKTVNNFRLDGKQNEYNSLRGPIGKCKGHIKRKTLILEVFWTATTHIPDHPDGATSVYSREVWELSRDSKTLTIHGEESTGAPFPGQLPPWTEIYTRN